MGELAKPEFATSEKVRSLPDIDALEIVADRREDLGNIKVGDCVRVAAGSVVLHDVPPRRTVAGVPAHDVGPAGCEEPALAMDQLVEEQASC